MGRPFNPRIRHKLDQPSLQDLADRLRSSNPHRSCERRQRLFLNAVSSLGGFRTPASPCLARPAPEADVRNPSPLRTYGRGHGALAPRMLLGRAKVSSLLGLRTADRPASKLVLERDRDCRLTSDRNLDARLVAAEPQIHSSIKPGDIALACCPPALWALCHVFAKPAIAHFPPLFMIGLAYAVSALVLLRLALRSKTRWWAMFTIAAFGGAIQSSLIFSGLQRLPASTAILVMQSQVPFAILCARAICGERPGVRRLSGIGIVLVGIVLIAGAPEAVDALGALSALSAVLLGTLSWSIS